jgi:hypothetical protein
LIVVRCCCHTACKGGLLRGAGALEAHAVSTAALAMAQASNFA